MNTINFEKAITEKLRSLPPEKQQEVLDFTEFLCHQAAKVDRRAFLQIPADERSRILIAQSEEMVAHYEQDTEWKEWAEVGIGDIYEYESLA